MVVVSQVGFEDLVRAAKGGDRLAFDEIVRRTYAETYTLAFRLTGQAEDAGDVVQEAYLRAFRALAGFREDSQFRTWLYRITANCAATHLGKGRRHRHEELDSEESVPDLRVRSNPESSLDVACERARLVSAMRKLPPRLRQVIVLRDIYDLSHQAISEELGISEAAAKVRVHRARRRLRAELDETAKLDAGRPEIGPATESEGRSDAGWAESGGRTAFDGAGVPDDLPVEVVAAVRERDVRSALAG
jgi:RNA polymerase sigma-70 factor (ECF subfamily)